MTECSRALAAPKKRRLYWPKCNSLIRKFNTVWLRKQNGQLQKNKLIAQRIRAPRHVETVLHEGIGHKVLLAAMLQ